MISVVLLATLLAGVSLGGVAIADVSIAADEESIPEHSEEIDEPLQDAEGETELILRLDPVNDAHLAGDREATVETLQSHADRTQQPVLDRLEHMGGVAVEDRWWIVNGILITADLDRVDLEELRSIENVELVHEHYTFDAPEPVQTEPVAETTDGTRTDDVEATYGLEQIKALDTWDEIGVTGADVRVVVADTGVDANHPDIELPEEDGWNDLADGEDEPADEHGHGTHVGGTIAGGDASGTAIGVAPEAEQAHARVCGADGLCEGQAIYDSFEWAVETDSDLISLSLGSASPHGQYTELIHNTMNAGTLVVASIGNDGEGTAGSPGADYDSIASGASNETGGIASFSGGMLIEEGDFDGEWMDHWPEGEFVTPDIAAPGADVYSAHPTDGGTMCGDVDYCEVSGTSMSAPHKSGAAALIIGAAGGELDPWDVKELMLDTAWKPDDWDPDDAQYYDEEGGIDSRYGAGIIDVYAATAQVAVDSGVEGVVTDADGEPIDGAAVTVEDGASTETDADGGYDLIQAPGTYDVTADGFGFAAQTETVTIDDDEHVVERDFALEAALAIELVDGQDETIEGGDGVTAEFDAANLEELVVEIGGSYDESDATLFVDGTEAQFGEPVDFDGDEDAVEVVVETTTNTEGEFSLEHSFEGLGDEETITTGPTTVFEELQPVAVVDDGDTFGDDVAEMLSASLPENYDLFVADSDEAAEEFDVIVVQHLDADDAADFVDATADGDTGVVYLDQWGNWSNGVPVYSDVTDDPGATSEDYNDSEPVIYKFVDDHEIFDGVGEAGDSIDVHFDTYGDHTWFADTSFDVYAEIGDQEGIAGDAFAVDEESATVLASGLGYTSFVTDDDYTDDAHAILANSVEFLASEVVDHPTFSGSVEIVDNPAPEGAIVEAYVDDELRGTTAVETPGEFDELVVDGEAAVDDGATIAFAVGGLPVDQEATWSEGSHEQLDLTASGNATVELEAGDDRFGEPIEDATIAATGEYGEFDATESDDGEYVIEGLPADEYDVVAEASGYESEADNVNLSENETAELDFWLVGDASIDGSVDDAVTSAPIANASVVVAYPGGERTIEPIETDASGNVTVEDVPGTNETYAVAVEADGYENGSTEVTVDSEETAAAGTIELAGAASVAGTVADGDGDPLGNATVTATGAGGEYVALTDADGEYAIEDVPGTGDDVDVTVERRAYEPDETAVENLTGDVTGVNATLTRENHYYGVDDLAAPETVEEGDSVGVEATITNLGTDAWNDTVEFRVDDGVQAAENVSLNATENATVVFDHEPADAGEVTYAIATANESSSTTTTVEEASGGGIGLPAPPPDTDPVEPAEPALSVVEHDLSATEIEVDESITVEATIENAGDAGGSTTLELTVDGEFVAQETVDVPAEDLATVDFEHTFREPGTYELAVDGEVVGTVEVTEPDDEPADDGATDDEPAGDGADDGLPGFGVAVALVALSALAAASVRRT